MHKTTQNTQTTLKIGKQTYQIVDLPKLAGKNLQRLPFSLRILLENLLRNCDGVAITEVHWQAILNWNPKAVPSDEIAFTPARVILQDLTGVPAVVDLAAMRDAVVDLGGDAKKINPLVPMELVVDHSVQVDRFGTADSLAKNNEIEFKRNRERYEFLRWGQQAFANFKVVPPNTGIVHQVNLEHLARVVFSENRDGVLHAYPDTLVGTDSHTTMINALGVLGWGVGGIEAEAAMLGQPVTMLIPEVVGVKVTGALPRGATATDLVLEVTERLRKVGVVGKFVEFCGDGLEHLTLADRATLANMSPEFGSTCAIFPIDSETIRYLKLSGRSESHTQLVESYAKAQGLWRERGQALAEYSQLVEIKLNGIEPCIAGPKRPQDRIPLSQTKQKFAQDLAAQRQQEKKIRVKLDGKEVEMHDGSVLIAAITSCTNTSNPTVMLGAGLLARNARNRGLQVKPWVKTSLAPGSKVVTRYLENSGLLADLQNLGFYIVGYGCTTCIGNSGPLPESVANAVSKEELIGCAVLSGNRNFEGRIHPLVRMNYLASPPLVVAYALAGTMNIDFEKEPIGVNGKGESVFLRDIWPNADDVQDLVSKYLNSTLFVSTYNNVFNGDKNWDDLDVSAKEKFDWDPTSTYVRKPPYFAGMSKKPSAKNDIIGARVLAMLADSVTTDHISPAGNIATTSPAAKYLMSEHVDAKDFNSYGARRGNHEVMVRGTFANIRLRNQLAPGTEGGWTRHLPSNEVISIYDAAQRYRAENIPSLVLAGKEYGSGSSRDWAAKGPYLLGIKAAIAESFERIHRSNLIGMGILPLEFADSKTAASLGLIGEELFSIRGIADMKPGATLKVTAKRGDKETTFNARSRIDTPKELEYYQHGGILQYVLRSLITNQRTH